MSGVQAGGPRRVPTILGMAWEVDRFPMLLRVVPTGHRNLEDLKQPHGPCETGAVGNGVN